MYSPTGYFAHFKIRFDGTDNGWVETYPVVGHADGVALIIDEEGMVRTVTSLLEELTTGGSAPDPEGDTFQVYLSVDPHVGE